MSASALSLAATAPKLEATTASTARSDFAESRASDSTLQPLSRQSSDQTQEPESEFAASLAAALQSITPVAVSTVPQSPVQTHKPVNLLIQDAVPAVAADLWIGNPGTVDAGGPLALFSTKETLYSADGMAASTYAGPGIVSSDEGATASAQSEQKVPAKDPSQLPELLTEAGGLKTLPGKEAELPDVATQLTPEGKPSTKGQPADTARPHSGATQLKAAVHYPAALTHGRPQIKDVRVEEATEPRNFGLPTLWHDSTSQVVEKTILMLGDDHIATGTSTEVDEPVDSLSSAGGSALSESAESLRTFVLESRTLVESSNTKFAGHMQSASNPSEQIAKTMIVQAEVAQREGHAEFRLRLEPPELGTIHVQLRMTEQALMARMYVHEEAARQLVEGHLESLRNRLAQVGIPLGRLDVSGGNAGSQAPWRGPVDEPEEQTGFVSGLRRKSPTPVTIGNRAGSGLLDVWV